MKFRNPKPRDTRPTLQFHLFEGLFMFMFGHRNPQSFELWKYRCIGHTSFHFSPFQKLWSEIPDTPTPRVSKSPMGSHFSSFSLFTILEVVVCKGLALKSWDSESWNPKWGPTFPIFHFSWFLEFWGVEVRFGNHETLNPETPKCESHSSLFSFLKLLWVDVRVWNSWSLKPRNGVWNGMVLWWASPMWQLQVGRNPKNEINNSCYFSFNGCYPPNLGNDQP